MCFINKVYIYLNIMTLWFLILSDFRFFNVFNLSVFIDFHEKPE